MSLTESREAPSRSLHNRRRFRPGILARFVGLVAVIALFGIPIMWMIIISFKATPEILADAVPVSFRSVFTANPTLTNYVRVLSDFGFAQNLFNSALISVLQMTGSVVTSTVAAYAFARLRFRGRTLAFGICMIAAIVPGEAIFLPEFRLVSALGLNDTYAGVILPFMFSPFAIFLMRQAFLELPNELFEAASLDGVGVWRSFLTIAVPNVRAPLVTVTLIQFIWAWNAYIWPLVIIQDPTKQTAQVAAAYFKSVPNHPMNGEFMAALSMTAVPLIILTVILQKYYVRGLVATGSKG